MMTKMNLFKRTSSKGIIFDITLTGTMLALVVVFQYLEQFMPWLGGALKINLSLVFIIMSWMISGYPWMIFLLLVRFVIGPSASLFSYTSIGIYSSFILLFSEAVFLINFIMFFYIFNFIIKNEMLGLILILLCSTIVTTLFLTLMNGLWISPIYWHLFAPSIPLYPKIINYYHNTSGLHMYLFFIPNYWEGIWLVMGTGNLLKFAIVSICLFPIIKIKRYLV